MEEKTPIKVFTKITLKKYDGDPPQPGEEKEPVETIVIEDAGFTQAVEDAQKKEGE